ncbi:hypothetical protein [Sphingomonas aerophila]|jgi:hypothetical protein|uniref:Uncharacterized protein n=1 Tax=Sphingomonas aerophila TaxID=1344948 RepID=A0A7W9ETC1_9SPHN|nr:hypothetical protein [Sphingomonas aerophila]MBB5714034.1 hypothetical protein [Sphingomonas aerophila]
MTFLALALLQAVPALGAIGPQAMPATGCAAFLWQTAPTPPQLIAMAGATPATLRVTLDDRPMILARTAARGDARFGLPAGTDYAGNDITATLELTITEASDLSDGARVPAGTLTVARKGSDTVVLPVAGLIGCRAARR